MHPVNSHIRECTACSTTQKLTNPNQTAKLIMQSGTKMLTLRAYDEALRAITDSQIEVSSQDLLYAPPFDCTYNKLNVITEKCCKCDLNKVCVSRYKHCYGHTLFSQHTMLHVILSFKGSCPDTPRRESAHRPKKRVL